MAVDEDRQSYAPGDVEPFSYAHGWDFTSLDSGVDWRAARVKAPVQMICELRGDRWTIREQ